jgi:hypothetical protein
MNYRKINVWPKSGSKFILLSPFFMHDLSAAIILALPLNINVYNTIELKRQYICTKHHYSHSLLLMRLKFLGEIGKL